ncbi:MAG: hypothetical protein B7X10_03030, partial [Burkholderiales bacterium 21-58-4]
SVTVLADDPSNLLVGSGAGININGSASDNAAIGDNSLATIVGGSDNVALGYGADVNSGAATNRTAIGFQALATADNEIQLGNTSVTLVNTSGTLQTSGGIDVTAGTVKLASLAAGTATSLLGIDASNHVVLASSSSITGTGTSGTIPIWTSASALGNSALAETYNTSAPYSATSSGEQLLATDAGATNISIALQPKGNGALEAQIADNTATGGNIRGRYAVDWQMDRGANTQVASGDYATASGGQSNTASGSYATVSGGQSNTVSNNYATVSGGVSNTASNNYATVSGGGSNTASSYFATVSGGGLNTASGSFATVSGGSSDTASGGDATVSGGYQNTASNDYSAIPGGEHLTISGHDDFGFLGRNDNSTPGNPMSIAANNTAVFGNANLWLASNDGAAHGLYLFAPGSSSGAFDSVANKFVAFESGVVTASQILTLPLAQPAAGQVLGATAVGGTEPYAVTLGWVTPGLSH